MKVISGKLKGRNIEGYNIVGTRPTMDRVKESLFSMIQNRLNNSIVLDLFAGSGNYGIEAYSNGAKFIYANDCNHKCIETIKNNLSKFSVLENFQLTCMDYLKCLEYLKKHEIKLDLVFLDPPYKMNVYQKIMEFLVKNKMLNDKALVICELTTNTLSSKVDTLSLLKSKKYGKKYVLIYQNDL